MPTQPSSTPKPRVNMDPHHRQPQQTSIPPRGRPAGARAGAIKDIRQTKEYKVAARRYVTPPPPSFPVLLLSSLYILLCWNSLLTWVWLYRWISVMVGLPILMYTSWSLYERSMLSLFPHFFGFSCFVLGRVSVC